MRSPLLPRMTRCLLIGALLLTCAPALAQGSNPSPWRRPRLVVHVSVDQLRFDFITRFAGFLPDGGLRRLIHEGAVFTDAHYRYASTYTGPGHATQLTGAYANAHGIVGNRVWDPALQAMVPPCDDQGTKLVGIAEERAGASPRRLLASTLADELRLAFGPDARTIAVSLKDRASVLMGGRSALAVWFDRLSGRFVTSTFYRPTAPAWLSAFNARDIPQGDFGKTWQRRGPAAALRQLSADDAPWEEPAYGLGRTFPREIRGLNGTRDITFFKAWTATSYAMQATRELAFAAQKGAGLGADDTPDILAISVSPFDYAGHSFGPHSHELLTLFFDLDDLVRDLLQHLDTTVGEGKWVLSLTGDHGGAAVPEYLQSLGLDAGRVFPAALAQAIEQALDRQIGAADWVTAHKLPLVVLSEAAIAAKQAESAVVQDAAAAAVLALPGVARVFTAARLATGAYPLTPLTTSILRSYHPERFGHLYVLPRPNWIWGYQNLRTGTGHSTPYNYDTHVPIILYGYRVRPGVYSTPVEVVDLAPTLAELLLIERPSHAQGRALREALTAPEPL